MARTPSREAGRPVVTRQPHKVGLPSFRHGQSKVVTVEVKKKRVVTPSDIEETTQPHIEEENFPSFIEDFFRQNDLPLSFQEALDLRFLAEDIAKSGNNPRDFLHDKLALMEFGLTQAGNSVKDLKHIFDTIKHNIRMQIRYIDDALSKGFKIEEIYSIESFASQLDFDLKHLNPSRKDGTGSILEENADLDLEIQLRSLIDCFGIDRVKSALAKETASLAAAEATAPKAPPTFTRPASLVTEPRSKFVKGDDRVLDEDTAKEARSIVNAYQRRKGAPGFSLTDEEEETVRQARSYLRAWERTAKPG